MKLSFISIAVIALVSLVVSCKKDNYSAPGSILSGRIVYKGEALNFQRTVDRSSYRVRFQLWESGWGKTGAIDVPIGQNGTFSAELSDADYKMVFGSDNIPFLLHEGVALTKDTMNLPLHGSLTKDIEVIPYYMIRNATFNISKTDSLVSGNCKLEKIITGANGKNVERVYLYIGRTDFVDDAAKVTVSELSGSAIADLNSVGLSVKVPRDFNNNASTQVQKQNTVYARLGLKVEGKEHLIFSPIVALALN